MGNNLILGLGVVQLWGRAVPMACDPSRGELASVPLNGSASLSASVYPSVRLRQK